MTIGTTFFLYRPKAIKRSINEYFLHNLNGGIFISLFSIEILCLIIMKKHDLVSNIFEGNSDHKKRYILREKLFRQLVYNLFLENFRTIFKVYICLCANFIVMLNDDNNLFIEHSLRNKLLSISSHGL